MAGARIDIQWESQALMDALNHALTKSSDLSHEMEEIAIMLERSTRQRFDKEQAPDGTPWAPVTAKTQREKNKGYRIGGERTPLPIPGKILHGATLNLRDTIFPFHDADEAGLSTGAVTQDYAAAHQFGYPEGNIPQREYLGFSPDDIDYAVEVLRDAIAPR